MDTLLFSERSIWTMLHGIILGGASLLGLAAALYALATIRVVDGESAALDTQGRSLAWLLAFVAVSLWLTVVVGTYVSFPAYRATPPEGLTELAAYPRSLLQSDPATAWLHAVGMEIKEHVPWIAAMLATALAFVGLREGSRMLTIAPVRRLATWIAGICFGLVAIVSLLGVFINKVAPLE